MPAAGARALFSATRPHRLGAPRAALCASAPVQAAVTLLGSSSARSFRLSATARNGRPGDASTATAPKQNDKAPEKQVAADEPGPEKKNEPEPKPASESAAPASPIDGFKETLKSQGYGSARARASRRTVEEFPPVKLKKFKKEHVSLYEDRASDMVEMPPLEERDQNDVVEFTNCWVDAFLEHPTDQHSLDEPETSAKLHEEFFEAAKKAYTASLVQVAALAYHNGALPEHIAQFRQLYNDSKEFQPRFGDRRTRTALKLLTDAGQRWVATVRLDLGSNPSKLSGAKLAARSIEECKACLELGMIIQAELFATSMSAPRKQARDLIRPINVLSVMNHKGRSVVLPVIQEVATELKADVVHLDASTLGGVLGQYFGQAPLWSRAGFSTLAYSVAELNGRGSLKQESDMEQVINTITVSLPSRFRPMMPKRDGFGVGASGSDERWDDLKLNQALEALVGAADAKRKELNYPERSQNDILIIHVHEFIEINVCNENLISKLRAIVDRMFQKGRKVILVGSTSGDVRAASQWRHHILDAAREDCQIIPFHSSASVTQRRINESHDNLMENMRNIGLALRTLSGTECKTTNVDLGISVNEKGAVVSKDDNMPDALFKALTESVRDIAWCKRLVSCVIARSQDPDEHVRLRKDDLIDAFEFLSERDKDWAEIYPGAQPPHYTPVVRPSMPTFMGGGPEDWQPDSPSISSSNKNFDQYEKKLMTGLVDPNDLHTTFNDIILPSDTKESVINLTTLNIVRPEAFSYGVLKTERIPGCLLYGPPGTGKTLLAKAVAKESGAKMIEVSAASINDMYVGVSEKNVRALFSLARKMAPVVIFLDEADALLGARSGRPHRASHREVMTQFLREWDGLKDMRAFIMVATNRPFDLDEAVLRRLPRKILVDLPLKEQREAILRVMLQEEVLDASVDLAKLAADTELYSGSDLKNLCVATAMEAVREETRAKDAHVGPEPYMFPEKRTLTAAHFAKGLRDISASISEDMESLKAIRKFDERYGDSGRRKRGKRSMGFGVTSAAPATEEARVRQGAAASG